MNPEPTEAEQPQKGLAARLSSTPTILMVLFAAAATALTLGMLFQYRAILAPAFLALNLLLAAYPLYSWLTKHKVPRPVASVLTGLSVLVVMIVGILAIVWSMTSMVRKMSEFGPQFTQMYNDGIKLLAQLGFNEQDLLAQLGTISPASILNVVSGVLSNASGISGLIVVILVTLVFMFMDLPSLRQRHQIAGQLNPRFSAAIEQAVLGVRRYWLITTMFGLIVAVLNGLSLVAIGVSLPLVWAVFSFVTNYIPNLGFVIGLVPPALLALFEQGPISALIVVAVFSLINFVIQTLIQPKFTGDAVGITPTASFLSLLLWTAVLGGLGALIAIPLTLMIKALLIDNDPRAQWLNVLLAADPATARSGPAIAAAAAEQTGHTDDQK